MALRLLEEHEVLKRETNKVDKHTILKKRNDNVNLWTHNNNKNEINKY